MQAEDTRIKSLHQEASSHYLRGEFRQALEVWQGLIELDPEDERAQEGVRLCRLLVDEGAGPGSEPAPSPPQAEPAARAPFAEAAEGFDDDLDELDQILESGLGSSPGAGTAESATPQAEETAESEDAADEQRAVFFDFSNVPDISGSEEAGAEENVSGPRDHRIDLGDLADTGSLPVGEPTAAPAPVEAQSRVVDLPPTPERTGPAESEDAADAARGGGETQEAAAAELRSRVNELLAEALTAYEQDHKQEALAILNRIFILDENNHAALALHDNIRVELEAEQSAASEEGGPEAPDQAEASFAEDEAVPADVGGESPLETLPEADEEDFGPVPVLTQSRTDESFDDLDDADDLPVEQAPRRRLLGEGLLTRQNVFVAAALVVVVGVGGFLAFTFMGRSGEPAAGEGGGTAAAGLGPAVAVVLSEGGEDGAQPAADAATAVADTAPAAAGGAAAPAGPEPSAQDPQTLARRLDELLAQARQAMEREDWSAAVLACNQALEIDPSNTEARDDLAEAGKRYREERALVQRYQKAIEAFNDGNYRAALTLLYRLPPGEDVERIERYKRNGWYNMGIQALAVGDCKTAATHLGEARKIDPEDREVLLAQDLANSCPYSRDTETFRDEVRQLVLRGLDD